MLRMLILLFLSAPTLVFAACPTVLDHAVRPLEGSEMQSLCEHSGKVVLVVNTASRCGFTPQFAGLQALHEQYAEHGLVVVGFPSNDFAQELSDETEIAEFCQRNYGVDFPMYGKVSVRGDQAHPFFRALAEHSDAGYPRWNFHKYLVGRDGTTVEAFGTTVSPNDEHLLKAIEAEV